jgi:hypothetical protein
MSKNCKETYDVTMDVVNDALSRVKNFYALHPMPKEGEGDSVAFYFKIFTEQFVMGWKEIEYTRHEYDYNRQMAEHSDKSPSTLQRIYNKK